MPILGSASKPNDNQEGWGTNSKNQYADLFTFPAGGPWRITHIGFWAGGWNENATVKVALWTPSGTFLASHTPAAFQIANEGGLALGASDDYLVELATPKVMSGDTIYAGWVRDPNHSVQFPTNTGGTHVDHTTTSQPTDINTSHTHTGTPGIWLVYELANTVPNAPTLTSPGNGSILTDFTPDLKFTHSDPDADPPSSYDLQVDNNSDFSSPLWNISSQTSGISGNNITRTYAGSALSRGVTYYWRARTRDAEGPGAWSASRTFKINQLPSVTLATPPASGFPFIHNLGANEVWTSGGSHAKPRFTWSYSDPDGDAQAEARIRVYSASVGGSTLHDATQVGASTTYNSTWAGVMGTEYWFTVDVLDSRGEWAGETARRAFKMRWGQAVYEHDLGGSSAAWEWVPGSVTGGYAAYLFRSATGAGGSGASAWFTNIGAVTPDNYLNVLVRLQPSVAGIDVNLTQMEFRYLGSPLQPERWTFEPASGTWLLDSAIRRFGTKGMKAISAGGADDRWAFQVVHVVPNAHYVFSVYVNTGGGAIAGTVRLAITDPLDPTDELDLEPHNVGEGPDVWTETSDSSGALDGWQRLHVHYANDSHVNVGVKIEFVTTAAESIWLDAVMLEEGTEIPSPWTPGLIGDAVVIDTSGITVDANVGGVFRLRGALGDARDVIELGDSGLVFGGDTEVTSPAADQLLVGGMLTSDRVGRSVGRASSATTQSIPDSTQTIITHDTAEWTDGITTYTGGVMTINRAGLYLVEAHTEYGSNATGTWRIIGVGWKNGSSPTGWGDNDGNGIAGNSYAVNWGGVAGSGTRRVHSMWLLNLAVNDRLASFAYQNSGGNLDVINSRLLVVRIALA